MLYLGVGSPPDPKRPLYLPGKLKHTSSPIKKKTYSKRHLLAIWFTEKSRKTIKHVKGILIMMIVVIVLILVTSVTMMMMMMMMMMAIMIIMIRKTILLVTNTNDQTNQADL